MIYALVYTQYHSVTDLSWLRRASVC